MNLSLNQGSSGNAGAVELGGSAKAAPAQFAVGEVGFGPLWHDDEPTLRELRLVRRVRRIPSRIL